jgi:hypothetical protein
MSKKNVQDFWTGCFIIFFSVTFLTQTNNIAKNSALFPKGILVILIFSGTGLSISSLIGIVRSCFGGKDNLQEGSYITKTELVRQCLIPGAILLSVCLFLKILGFYICTAQAVFLFNLFQEYLFQSKLIINKRTVTESLIFGIGTAASMYVIFGLLLSLPTPKGIIGF